MIGISCLAGAGACKHLLCARFISRRYPATVGRADLGGIDTVSFALHARERVAVVGRSGAGKSTLARCLALWERPDTGEVWVGGTLAWAARDFASLRRHVQLVLQDAETAFNPRFSALEAVEEALRYGAPASESARVARARELLDILKLPRAAADRNARGLSGGERRRVLVARALATAPSVLILDETFTSLDGESTAHVSGELFDLQAATGFALIVITHDLAAAQRCDRLVVMDDGRITESGWPAEVFDHPRSAAGRAFAAAARRLMPPLAC